METITYAKGLNRKCETCPADKYEEICLKNKNCNEVIPDDRKVKLYFDIEIKPKDCNATQEYVDCTLELVNFAKSCIRDYLTAIKPNWCSLDSSSDCYVTKDGHDAWINSAHIIVSNYVASKKKLLSMVRQINKAIIDELNNEKSNKIKLTDWIIDLKKNNNRVYDHKFFDESVYDSNRKIRSAFCHKQWFQSQTENAFTDERQMRLVEGTFNQSVITSFYDEDTMEIMDDVDDDTDKESVKSVENIIEKNIIDGNEIEKLLEVIGSTLCSEGKQTQWSNVAQAIKNETKEEGLCYFANWTHKYGTENKKKECITHYNKYIKYTPKSDKKRLTIGSLHYWAKEANPKLYSEVFSRVDKLSVDTELSEGILDLINNFTDYAVARELNNLYPNQFICVDVVKKSFYCFDKETKLWVEDKGASIIRKKISTEFWQIFATYRENKQNKLVALNVKDPEYKQCGEDITHLTSIMQRLQSHSSKNNYIAEISYIVADTAFEKKLNKSHYLLPLNDGTVMDIRTLECVPRTSEHFFSAVCGACYQPNICSDKLNQVDIYFNDLFCGDTETKQCVLDILKSVFIGKPLRYIFFCIGSGSNGKSYLFGLLDKIFGTLVDTVSKKVIVEQKNESSTNTEIEKLDKCRLGYVSELKDTDTLNETTIKEVTGGDKINFRGLFKSDATIIPTCNLFVLLNVFPSFNGEAKAMLKRLIAIPFKASFETSLSYTLDINAVFTYILKRGNLRDNFDDVSPAMKEEALKHIRDNTDTTLETYIKTQMIDDDNAKPIVLNDFRIAFENYCAQNKLINTLSQKKFTAKCKTLGLLIKESNSKTRLYGKVFKEINDDDE